MNRCAFVPAAALACALVFAPFALAQAAKPTPATPAASTAPAAPAKFVPAGQGDRVDRVIPGASKRSARTS